MSGQDPAFEQRCGDYVISDDRGRFDGDALHDFLEREGYWARGRSREATATAVANSVVLGAYGPDGSMVGGARIVTDRATFGWLTDVYVLAEHRGRGLGQALAAAACEHPAVATVKRLMLKTGDAHGLYGPLGFNPLAQPERWMERGPARRDPASGTVEVAAADGASGTVRAAGAAGAAMAAFDHGRGATGEDPSTGASGEAPPAVGSRASIVADEGSDPVPYTAWHGDGLPDPRTAAVSQIALRLLEIVEAEGPVTSDRAYRLYIRGSGLSKVTQRARSPLEQALVRLAMRGQVEIDELDNAGSAQQVLRLSGGATVVVRELGDRSLYEVPLNEIAELMGRRRRELIGRAGGSGQPAHAVADLVLQATLRRASPDRLKRAVLNAYGLIRMTQAAEQYLEAALALVGEPDPSTGVPE